MVKYGYVYKIACKTNGKIYIGQTTQNLKERLKQHFYNSVNDHRTTTKLGRAILKHGRGNFEIYPLCHATSKEELNNREIFCINIFNSIENGYNISRGGHNSGEWSEDRKKKMSLSRKGKPKPKGFGEKISKALKGKKKSESHRINNKQAQIDCQAHHDYRHTPESRNKISVGNKGKKKPEGYGKMIAARNTGRKASDETKKKMLEKRKGRKPPNQRSITCLNNGNTYISVKSAADILNISLSSLGQHLSGKLKTAGGFIFKYT